jgi:hypothetical protein
MAKAPAPIKGSPRAGGALAGRRSKTGRGAGALAKPDRFPYIAALGEVA